MASLEKLVRDGVWGTVSLAMSEADVVASLGAPDYSGGQSRKHRRANIWRYGDVELAFSRPDYLLHCISINFANLEAASADSGRSVHTTPWLFTRDLRASDFVMAMREAEISCVPVEKPPNEGCVEYVVGSKGAYVVFGPAPSEVLQYLGVSTYNKTLNSTTAASPPPSDAASRRAG